MLAPAAEHLRLLNHLRELARCTLGEAKCVRRDRRQDLVGRGADELKRAPYQARAVLLLGRGVVRADVTPGAWPSLSFLLHLSRACLERW